MKLKDAILTPCGLRYMVDELDIQSGVARRTLLDKEMSMNTAEIQALYAAMKEWADCLVQTDNTIAVRSIRFRLQGLKDLHTTLDNLGSGRVLDDIELFEIKHLALLSLEVGKSMAQMGRVLATDDMQKVVAILDPDGMQIATFHVYDAYSSELARLRKELEQNPLNDQVYNAIEEEELKIRTRLSGELRTYCSSITEMMALLIAMDINMAKAEQMLKLGLCIPQLGEGETHLHGLWNPEVNDVVERKGGHYQKVDISFGHHPVVITGSNMGGKTVVLKTVALCQYLAQFGFGIPAGEAHMAIREAIMCCMADGQSIESGLSSFAAEMKQIDEVIRAARKKVNLLALIDEPARTTNPIEGTALVSGLIETLAPMGISALLVTHYTINAHACTCLRVRGLENGKMNYALIAQEDGEVPHEALNIAGQLGVDGEWLERAQMELEKRN